MNFHTRAAHTHWIAALFQLSWLYWFLQACCSCHCVSGNDGVRLNQTVFSSTAAAKSFNYYARWILEQSSIIETCTHRWHTLPTPPITIRNATEFVVSLPHNKVFFFSFFPFWRQEKAGINKERKSFSCIFQMECATSFPKNNFFF